jgi:hypothetical protein
MSSSHSSAEAVSSDSQVWESLKRAIAESSGFHRWQLDRTHAQDLSLDAQVHQYLRETLETLAY